jgi:uncharacterized protein (UPF0218 family)
MLKLPESLREEVRKPFGPVLGKGRLKAALASAKRPLISVGDQCAFDLISDGNAPDILVFDFKIKRVEIGLGMKQAFAPHAASAFMVLSPPGIITDELIFALDSVLAAGQGAVFVVGEDDLTSLLVMARATGGTLVYGQPDEGAVVVELGGKKLMEKAQGFLDRMEKA